MASLVLGTVGTVLGGSLISGTVLGLSGAAVGGLIGSTVGTVVDSWIVSALAPGQRIEGARLDSLRVTSATKGAVLPRLYGRMRIGGNIIWATDFREDTRVTRQGGGKGGGPKVTTTEYIYSASFAVASCEGTITGIGRVWADGKPMDMQGVVWRWYAGDEDQTPDPFIAARMGAASTPAYRGTAYVVFEELPLESYSNRLPQLSFEVFRSLASDGSAERLIKAVAIGPGCGEFAYATQPIRSTRDDITVGENVTARIDTSDIMVALDTLEASLPNVRSATLPIAWFADDLRAGVCTLRPGVEAWDKVTAPLPWSVNGVARAHAHLVSRDQHERPVLGGTPADFSVVQAIRELRSRGLRVTLSPLLLMDVPPGNTRPNPYSDAAGDAGQPACPWRGRITCSPAAGFAGIVDKTAAAAAQVAALFGSASPSDFTVAGEAVSWTGTADDWGLRRMVLHYAHLCAAAEGVDAFLIASGLRGLTQIRSGVGTYLAVQALRALVADVRTILGPDTQISYAAHWSEYSGHRPQDGSGDVHFHLDPLWADPRIDFIGIDNFMPLSDWRDGDAHVDAALWPAIHDRAYLQSNIAGGEGFDWIYASDADRSAQRRTPITDTTAGKPWVFRPKDLRSWWSSPHCDRPDGVESTAPTAWVPQSRPIRFTALGCPAIDRGTNQPDAILVPAASGYAVPYFSRGWRDDAIQRAYLEATLDYWSRPGTTPVSAIYGAPMIRLEDCAAFTWDARPYAPPFYLSDRLPLSTVTALPLVGNVTDQQALNDAFNSLALNELNEAEVLPLGVRTIRSLVTAPYQIMSRDGKISTLEELAGAKMRSSGGVQERSVENLGAAPVAIPAPDLYPALQRGTVDGTLFNLPTAAGYKLQEQLEYSTDNLNLGLFPVLYVINEDVWQTLPEDIQTAMIEAAREVVPSVIEADKKGVEDFRKGVEENGGGLYQIDADQLTLWNERLAPVRDDWVERLEAQSKPAQAILDRWTELVTE